MEYNQNGLDTGYSDLDGNKIHVGDIMKSVYGYSVLVCQDKDGDFYGSLVCEVGHSCRMARYSIDEGNGYTVIGKIG
jgi:hypothetical protein